MLLCIARLAQSAEHETLNLGVVGSSPTLGVLFHEMFIVELMHTFSVRTYQVNFFN